jgi:hypothetical protein
VRECISFLKRALTEFLLHASYCKHAPQPGSEACDVERTFHIVFNEYLAPALCAIAGVNDFTHIHTACEMGQEVVTEGLCLYSHGKCGV